MAVIINNNHSHQINESDSLLLAKMKVLCQELELQLDKPLIVHSLW